MDTETEHDAPEALTETAEAPAKPAPTREDLEGALGRMLMDQRMLDRIWDSPQRRELQQHGIAHGWAQTVAVVVTNPKRFGKLRWTGLFSTKDSKQARTELAAKLAELPPPNPFETDEPPAGS